jgi:hypothetical protein
MTYTKSIQRQEEGESCCTWKEKKNYVGSENHSPHELEVKEK